MLVLFIWVDIFSLAIITIDKVSWTAFCFIKDLSKILADDA